MESLRLSTSEQEERPPSDMARTQTAPTALDEISPEKASSGSDRRLQDRLQDTARRARRYFESARAPATVRAYASDLTDFETWCKIEAGGLSTLPATAETVALYIADAAGRGLKASTISRRLTAISVLHKAAGLDSPALDERVKDVFKGIKREHGSSRKARLPCSRPP